MLMFPQWLELLKNIFESFLLLLQRIQVGLHLLPRLSPPAFITPCLFQATLSIIRSVVLGVQLSGQKQAIEEAGPDSQPRESPCNPALLQEEAELAYLTHEGLFISDALSQFQQQVPDHSQRPGAAPGGPQSQPEAAGSDSVPEAAETFTYVCGGASQRRGTQR